MDDNFWNRAANLLHVAEKSNQWPTLHGLRDQALEDLKVLHEKAKAVLDKARPGEAKVEEVAAKAVDKVENAFQAARDRLNKPEGK